mgnify:FL=1
MKNSAIIREALTRGCWGIVKVVLDVVREKKHHPMDGLGGNKICESLMYSKVD